MSTDKHTPGPWTAKPTGPWDGWDGWSVEDAAGTAVCDAHGSQLDGAREANARLIAAAPDLLYALVAARSELWRLLDLRGIEPKQAREWPEIVRAEEAIAKAYRGAP